MTPVVVALCSVSAFLGLPLLVAAAMRWSAATRVIYGACVIICLVVLVVALTQLLSAGSTPSSLRLPLGLPWIGAHFRIDALAAFFLAVVNLGGASASLFAIGYGKHEKAPGRVLPFYAAFLAGMNLVVLADDAFTFLVSWEFMSLSSWALVMAHHHDPGNRHAVYGFIRIVFDLCGPPAWWWSIVIIPLAGITCVLGVLSALMQHDLKRLLAYHTVENIGIIFVGLGLALALD